MVIVEYCRDGNRKQRLGETYGPGGGGGVVVLVAGDQANGCTSSWFLVQPTDVEGESINPGRNGWSEEPAGWVIEQ